MRLWAWQLSHQLESHTLKFHQSMLQRTLVHSQHQRAWVTSVVVCLVLLTKLAAKIFLSTKVKTGPLRHSKTLSMTSMRKSSSCRKSDNSPQESQALKVNEIIRRLLLASLHKVVSRITAMFKIMLEVQSQTTWSCLVTSVTTRLWTWQTSRETTVANVVVAVINQPGLTSRTSYLTKKKSDWPFKRRWPRLVKSSIFTRRKSTHWRLSCARGLK